EPHDAGASAVALQPDGKIVVAGFSGNGTAPPHAFLLARYLDDGTLDTTFGGGKGFVSAEFGRPVAVAADVGLQSDGAIVVVGTAFDSVTEDGAVLALARWSARGTLDAD